MWSIDATVIPSYVRSSNFYYAHTHTPTDSRTCTRSFFFTNTIDVNADERSILRGKVINDSQMLLNKLVICIGSSY